MKFVTLYLGKYIKGAGKENFPAPNLFEVVNQLRELGTKLLGGQ